MKTTVTDPFDRNTPERAVALEAVHRERAYQKRRWPNHPHEIPTWIVLARRELEEAELAWAKGNDDLAALAEIVQATAVLLACLEQQGAAEESNRQDVIGRAPCGITVVHKRSPA